ncbi:hypothetical protein HOLleu_04457 [Holothuria leucospilota]|uniref:Uncharacterized protein n=1 Tax=Holothuria leucospilota TaxID=206669 RepID=A0A9Q1CSZ6_HOLLE|nr:hypothetical protein HOLleu_04457 [Holothuria leucospilota]
MGKLEQEFIASTSYILPNTWKRFIDDIQFLWTLTPRNLSLFQTLVNTRHPTIKYTFNSSQDNIQFLDIQSSSTTHSAKPRSTRNQLTLTHSHCLHHANLNTLLQAFYTVRLLESSTPPLST